MASYPAVKQTAVDVLGNADKPALLAGIGVLLALYSLALGWIALRRSLLAGEIMVGLFAVIGVWAALGRASDGSLFSTLPTIIGAAVGVLLLRFLAARLTPVGTPSASDGQRRRARRRDRPSPLPRPDGRSARRDRGRRRPGGRRRPRDRDAALQRRRLAQERHGADGGGSARPGAGRCAGARRGDDAVHHTQPRLLPRRHGARGPAALDGRLHVEGEGHGRPRARVVVGGPAQPPDDRARHHDDVRVEHRGRQLRRYRPVDRSAPRRPVERGRRPPRRRHGRRALERRLGVRLSCRQRDGRPRRHHRRRHERRAAAARARLPRPPGRARLVRLRVRHEVAHRDRAHPLRSLRALLGAPRLGREGTDQADEPHRRPEGTGQGGGGQGRRRRRRVGPDHRHLQGRGAGGRRRMGRGHARCAGHRRHVAAMVLRVGGGAGAPHAARRARRAPTASCRPISAPTRSPTARRDATRSSCSSTDQPPGQRRETATVGQRYIRARPDRGSGRRSRPSNRGGP